MDGDFFHVFNLSFTGYEWRISFYDRLVQLCPEERGNHMAVKQELNIDLMQAFCQVIDRFGSTFAG